MDTQINDSSTNDQAQLRATTSAPLAGEGTSALAAAPCSARLVVTSSGSIYNLDHIVSIFPATVENGNFWMYMTSNGVIHSMGNQDVQDVRDWILSEMSLSRAPKLSCIPFSGIDGTAHQVNQAQMQSPSQSEKLPQSSSQTPQ